MTSGLEGTVIQSLQRQPGKLTRLTVLLMEACSPAKVLGKLSMVAHTYNSRTWKAQTEHCKFEARLIIECIRDQSEPYVQTFSEHQWLVV